MIWVQRSVDSLIGLPSDIASAALFNILMAQTVGLRPGEITFQLGDTHIYSEHTMGLPAYFQQAASNTRPLPTWRLDTKATVFNFEPEMFEVIDYTPKPAVNFKLIA